MDKLTYSHLRAQAIEISSKLPSPDFYLDYKDLCIISEKHFNSDPIVDHVRTFVMETIDNDFGHGVIHSTKVSIDAGSILAAECRRQNKSEEYVTRKMTILQCAGMLHDYMRKKKDHARAGADFARDKLREMNFFTYDEIDEIWLAIMSHEAFSRVTNPDTEAKILISGSLYDADKFRWGPDNFTRTVWKMVEFSGIPVRNFLQNYARGMDSLRKIKKTFRTETGKKYGPQFIDMGIYIGEELIKIIKQEFPDYLK